MINKIVDICQDALQQPYQLGKNDCNILVLKVIDLMCSTEYVKMCKYDTLRKGRNILKKLGVESTFELIEKYLEEVEFPIPGDIWIDEYDSTVMSVYVSNRILVVDEQHTHFELDFPTDGKFYRVRRSNG
ncbi:ornithine carbamoyltransferase [Serratia nevei]|uniref:DUF6950 family protein n=1 Tax=Serratia nevei TaxID=2703794 RepID=UPI0027D22E52|nr:ornithine carbamoyltransferase [Serratia nevei]WMC77803.1 ornithine carbamoyltransferase [Serratia nevei]WMC83114.1 ornithine carbamoyltransferase [Serratia nevei]